MDNSLLQRIAEEAGKNCFNEYCDLTTERRNEEGLGIRVAQWAEWSGDVILRVFRSALEDANFHTEAALVEKMLEKL